MNDETRQVLTAILEGHCDAHYDEIYAALKQRRKTMATITALDLQVGDRVRVGNITPKSLDGMEGVVTSRPNGGRSKRFGIKFDQPGYARGRLMETAELPAACLTRIES